MHEYFSEKEKKELVKTRTIIFDYNPLVWHFCGKGDLYKMEEVQERAIRFIKNYYFSEYADILRDLGEDTLYPKRIRPIVQEIFMSFKRQNPEYIQTFLGKRHATQPIRGNERPLQLYVGIYVTHQIHPSKGCGLI